MPALQGEYFCKVDSKGRVRMPGKLLTQFHPDFRDKFVINRGFEQHLNIYPKNVWDRISAQLNKLSGLDPGAIRAQRFMLAGSAVLDLDSADRLLISKQQKMYAGIEKQVVLLAYKNKVEVWNEGLYLENFVKVPDLNDDAFNIDILKDIDDDFDVLDI